MVDVVERREGDLGSGEVARGLEIVGEVEGVAV